MTMDYHHPYNVYPEYYCPTYEGSGYQYPPQQQHHHLQQQQQQPHLRHHSSSGPLRNYNNNIIGPPIPSQHHHLSHQQQQQQHHHQQPQRQQPYFPPFQQHNQPQQHSNYSSSSYLPNFLVSSGTGLTPTLTPTTLATIEQSFMELQSGQQNGSRDPVTQSGFMPPVVDPGHSADVSQDSLDYSSDYSESEWEPKAKRGRMSQDMKNVDLIVTSTGTINAAPQRKYTRRNKDEKLPPEEEERRRIRRERNKIAAAKCRQRRVDHTNELVEETEKLEAEQSQLESEIQSLQQERDQLEFILQAHQPLCKVDPRGIGSKVKVEPGSRSTSCSAYQSQSNVDTSCPAPENLSMSSSAGAAAATATSVAPSAAPPATTMSTPRGLETPVITSRPNSLPLIKRDRARMLSMSTATGVTINTPTSGVSITPSSLFCPTLDSMVDGSTGLTPLTGMSCSSQVQRNSSESSSEAVGSPTLISL